MGIWGGGAGGGGDDGGRGTLNAILVGILGTSNIIKWPGQAVAFSIRAQD